MKSVNFDQLSKTLGDPVRLPQERVSAAEAIARAVLDLGNDAYQALLLVAVDQSVDCEVARAAGKALGALVAVNHDADLNFLARDFTEEALNGYFQGLPAAIGGTLGSESRFGPGTEFLKNRAG